MRYLLSFLGATSALLQGGCPGPKEAENPRTLLGEDLSHDGVYGGGTAPDTPGSAADPPPAAAAGTAEALDGPATRDECAAAAAHLVTLGIDLAIAQESDPEKKRRLAADRKAALESERAAEHRAEWARECLERGTTRREARCIARIRAETDIDASVGGP
jgi:hypothetical protein